MSQAPQLMATNGRLDDLKLWISLQGDAFDPKHPHWASFANAAAGHGHLDILQYIHELGVSLEQFNSLGRSPLHSASSANKVEITRWLLEAGIPPDLQQTVNHPTALHQAARYGKAETTAFLLEAGADPLINSRSGTAFELADNIHIRFILMAHWRKHGDGMPPPGVSPAAWWSFIGKPDQVPESLLKQDLQKNVCNALHWAAAAGHIPTLQRLLELAPLAALSSQCFDSWTPLKLAIRFNHPEVIAELLNHWQQVEVLDIRLAVQYGSATLARTLYESLEEEPAPLNFHPRAREGNAVLVDYVPEDLASLVIRRVISPDWMLKQIARQDRSLIELTPLVMSQGISINQVLRAGFQLNNQPLIEWVTMQNPPLRQTDEAEPSPYMIAAEAGDTRMAKKFWHPQAILGDDNYYQRLDYFVAAGWTEKVLSLTRRRSDLLAYALNEAAHQANVDLMMDLVNAGARANRRRCSSIFNEAVLHQASLPALTLLAKTHSDNKPCLSEALLRAVKDGKEELLSPLLENGASPDGTGDGYYNAVITAVNDQKLVILMALLQAGADPTVVNKPEGTILELVKQALKHSGDTEQIAAVIETELSSLLKALKENDLEALQVLITAGVDLTQTNNNGETPAHIAMRARLLEAASLLLNDDVLRKKDKRGRTPFHLIGAYGSPELASQAMELSRGTYMQDNDEKYPLDYAIRMNEPVALILAKANAPHTDNLPFLAATYGQKKFMDYLSRLYKELASEEYEEKPEAAYFMVAVAKNDRDWYESLLNQSLEPNDTFAGESLLSMAARYNNFPAFELLVGRGAVLSRGFFALDRGTSYQFALLSQKPELSEILLNTLDSNKRGKFLTAIMKPLSQAMPEDALVSWLQKVGSEVLDQPLANELNSLIRLGENLRLLNALVRAGADLSEKDYSDTSPIQTAIKTLEKDIEWGHRIALVRLLLKNQQDEQRRPFITRIGRLFKDDKGKEAATTPTWRYLRDGFSAIANVDKEELNTADAVSRLTILDAAVVQGDINTIKFLLKKGATVTEQTLHIAAQTGRVAVLRALAPAIYDLNSRDYRGNTPLMTAVRADQREMIEALLLMGARPNVYNQDYRFPLKLAVFNQAEPVVRLLLNHGAHPDGFSEHRSSSALRSAVVNGKIEIVETLVNAGASEDTLLGVPPYSVLPAAYKFAPKEVVSHLEQTFPRTTEQQQSDLDLAWEHGSEWARKHLVQRGVSF